MTFRPYVPGHRNQAPVEFKTLADLELVPEVKAQMEAPGFHRLSLCMDGDPTIMAEFHHGSHFVVCGYIQPPVFQINLPFFRFRSLAFANE